MSGINPHVAAHNVPITRKQRRVSRHHYLQIATRGPRLMSVRSPIPRFSSFLFLYYIYASNQDTQVPCNLARYRDNIDIPLIDISIRNVNTDTESACTCSHTGGVAIEGES